MTSPSHSLSPLEKTFFSQWIQALISAQQNPRVENHLVETPVLRHLLIGLWNEVLNEINNPEQESLSIKNKTIRQELFDRVIRQYPGRLLTDEGRMTEGGQDFWDRNEYLDFLFQTFEKILILSYPELQHGYITLQPHWHEDITVTIPFGYPGIALAHNNLSQEESCDDSGAPFYRLIPGADLIGLLCLFNLSPGEFLTAWIQRDWGGHKPTSLMIDQFRAEWNEALERYTVDYGIPLHDPKLDPSVSLEDFCKWLHENLEKGDEFGPSGFVLDLHLKSEEIGSFSQKTKAARRNGRPSWLSLGVGTRIYDGEGNVKNPLILTAPLQIEPEWQDLKINESQGEQTPLSFPELLRNKARNRLQSILDQAPNTPDFLQEIRAADLTPGAERSFRQDQWSQLLALGVTPRAFNRQDLYPQPNEDLLFYWATPAGKDWVSPQGEPPASYLLGVWSPLKILDFSRTHSLSLTTPGADGSTPLHRLFALCNAHSYPNRSDKNSILEALIPWMTPESLQLLTLDGVTPLGVLIGDPDSALFVFERPPLSEKVIQHLDAIGVDFWSPQKTTRGGSLCLSQAFGLEKHPLVERQKLRTESQNLPAALARIKSRI